MIVSAVMNEPYRFPVDGAIAEPLIGIENLRGLCQPRKVLDSKEIVKRLEAMGVRNVDIARALGLRETRASEIRKGTRRLLYDEGRKLIEAFDLEGERPMRDPLPVPVSRLAVKYLAGALGAPLPDDQWQTLAEDLAALAALASEPGARELLDQLEGFLNGLTIRRRRTGEPVHKLRQASNH